MSSQPVDFEGMIAEIRALNEKYGVPRGIVFVPDKLEISLQRRETSKFSMSYQETFSYLPEYALNIATEALMQMIRQSGLPFSNVTRVEKGVRMEMTADLPVILSAILAELSIQRPLEDVEFLDIVGDARIGKRMFTGFSDLCWTWNDDVAKRLDNTLHTFDKIMAEHPSYGLEMGNIVRKYLPGTQ